MTLPDLRRRLLGMRAELVDRLGQGIDGGTLALLGSVDAAIRAVEAAAVLDADPADHVALSDDGRSRAPRRHFGTSRSWPAGWRMANFCR